MKREKNVQQRRLVFACFRYVAYHHMYNIAQHLYSADFKFQQLSSLSSTSTSLSPLRPCPLLSPPLLTYCPLSPAIDLPVEAPCDPSLTDTGLHTSPRPYRHATYTPCHKLQTTRPAQSSLHLAVNYDAQVTLVMLYHCYVIQDSDP